MALSTRYAYAYDYFTLVYSYRRRQALWYLNRSKPEVNIVVLGVVIEVVLEVVLEVILIALEVVMMIMKRGIERGIERDIKKGINRSYSAGSGYFLRCRSICVLS